MKRYKQLFLCQNLNTFSSVRFYYDLYNKAYSKYTKYTKFEYLNYAFNYNSVKMIINFCNKLMRVKVCFMDNVFMAQF